ncbi:hypothetical protein N431DRAFT_400864 [Stipitochalara longipes BDJ]|nr:hypothetical protein N431DRAFT_400864 [Stipitochalara longipes BDJ]
MTELRTLKDRCAGIPLHTMPPLFQDAVIITRNLGYRYLWIDCLCIIQDCPEDWTKESADMGHIYKNCHLSLAAEESQDSLISIFECSNKDREASRAAQCKIEIPAHVPHQSSRLRGKVFCGKLPGYRHGQRFWNLGALSSRAWTLQEMVLPPRILRYMKGYIWWECREAQIGEIETSSSHKDRPAEALNRLKQITRDSILPKAYFHKSNASRLWYSLINEYSSRYITFEEDKFPAISAAAKECRRHLRQKYKAGLWHKNMLLGLAWSGLVSMGTRGQENVDLHSSVVELGKHQLQHDKR